MLLVAFGTGCGARTGLYEPGTDARNVLVSDAASETNSSADGRADDGDAGGQEDATSDVVVDSGDASIDAPLVPFACPAEMVHCATGLCDTCGDSGGLQVGAPWPMQGRCPTRISRTCVVGPRTGAIKWTVEPVPGGKLYASPVVAADGTIYVDARNGSGAAGGSLCAVSRTGAVLWCSPIGGCGSSAIVLRDGAVAVGVDENTFLVVEPSGKTRWRFDTQGSFVQAAVAGDGTLYVSAYSGLFALDPNGKEKWSFKKLSATHGVTVAADGTVYVTDSFSLWALDETGGVKWSLATDAGRGPSIDFDGTLYAGSSSMLRALTADGSFAWGFPSSATLFTPAIGRSERVFVPSDDGTLYALKSRPLADAGRLLWKATTGGGIWGQPAVDGEGTVYFGSRDGNLYAVRDDGTVVWKIKVGDEVRSAPAIGADGTVYATTLDGQLTAVGP